MLCFLLLFGTLATERRNASLCADHRQTALSCSHADVGGLSGTALDRLIRHRKIIEAQEGRRAIDAWVTDYLTRPRRDVCDRLSLLRHTPRFCPGAHT